LCLAEEGKGESKPPVQQRGSVLMEPEEVVEQSGQ